MIDDKFLKKYNVHTLADYKKLEMSLDVLETGIFALDMALGEKGDDGRLGIRARSIVELIGDPNAGKSSATVQMIKTTIDRYGPGSVVALYSEPPDLHIYHDKGVDPDDVYVLTCYDRDMDEDLDKDLTVGDKQLNRLLKFVEQEEIRLAVIDSIAALTSYSQVYESGGKKEREVGESDPIAARAKLIASFLAKFQRRNKHSVLLMTNHYKPQVKPDRFSEVLPPDQIWSPGGREKEFLAKFRVHVRGWKEYEDELTIDGTKQADNIRDTFKVFKRKLGAPRNITTTLSLKDGTYNNEEKMIDYGSKFGTRERDSVKSRLAIPVAVSGVWYYIGNEKFHGKEKAVEYLKANPEIRDHLKMEIFKYSDEFFDSEEDLIE